MFEIKGTDVFIPGSLERTLVLKNINWILCKAEHSAILGSNGAGKSSLLKLIHGDLWPCRGSICWYDTEGRKQESRIAARELTALVSPAEQENWQRMPWPVSVRDFLALPEGTGEEGIACQADLESAVRDILVKSKLVNMFDKAINSLSQGQLRLLLLLRAILARPRVLLLDEYTDGLDGKNSALALDLLESVRNETNIIFTSHRLQSLPKWCEGRLYLHEGRRVEFTQTPQVKKETEALILGPRSIQPLFALSNVTVYIDRHKILEEINWECGLGEHWRIEGENGSGKSTFLRLLAGDEFAAADGEIKRWNPELGHWVQSLVEARSRFMLVSDLSQLRNDYPLCVLELLCSGFDNSTGLHREASKEEKERALAMLKEFFPEENLPAFAARDMRRLSTGQLRRLYLARAMLARPAALLLDEPLNGLDAQSREHYLSSLGRLASKGTDGPAIIMVSHHDESPAFIRRHARLESGRLKIVL